MYPLAETVWSAQEVEHWLSMNASQVRSLMFVRGMAIVAKSNRVVFPGFVMHIWVCSTTADHVYLLKTEYTDSPPNTLCVQYHASIICMHALCIQSGKQKQKNKEKKNNTYPFMLMMFWTVLPSAYTHGYLSYF